MDWNRRIRQAFAAAAAPLPDDDVIEELSQHAAATDEACRAAGHGEDEIGRRVDALVDAWVREADRLHRARKRPAAIPPPPADPESLLGAAGRDLVYALRLHRRQPRFAALVLLTMALGIGATTTLVGIAYSVLLRPLPWPAADRLLLVTETRGRRAPRFGSFSNAAYLAWRERPDTIDDLGAWSRRNVTLTEAGDPVRVRAAAITASVFRLTGAQPIAGDLFDDRGESSPVIVISETLWRSRFGGDPGTIGRAIRVDGELRTIVGVLPDRLAFPDRQTKAWLPFHVPPASGNYLSMFDAIARLRPNATPAQAAAEGTARGLFAADTGMTTTAIFGGSGPIEIAALPLADALTAEVRRPLIAIVAAMVLLLAIATGNVASLQLSRTAARQRELAIRASIGASAARIVRQLVIEGAVLGVLGSAAGIRLSWILQRTTISVLPADFPRAVDVAIDRPVVLVASAVSVLAIVVCGVLPAIRLRRISVVESLAQDGVSPAGLRWRSRTSRTRLSIVAGQTALASLLLVAALLLGESFFRQWTADRGYEPSRVLSAPVALPATSYTPARRAAALDRIVTRLAAAPGVRAAAFTSELPLTPGGSTSAFTLRARDGSSGSVRVQASPRIVSPQYFAALGLHLIEGRSLSDADTATSEPVCVVNRTFQRKYLGDAAIGAKLPMALWGQNQDGDATVVGVADDVSYIGSGTTSLPELYFSFRQLTAGVRPPIASLLVRTDGDPHAAAAAVRAVVTSSEPAVVPDSILTLEDRLLSGSLARPRLYALLVGGFAALAVLVTGIGLYGVLAYGVSLRTRELGVRAALGARRSQLTRLILYQGLAVAIVGLAMGLAVARALMRFIASLLYGVSADDWRIYAAVAAVLLAVSVAACVAPARRAATMDPLAALRS